MWENFKINSGILSCELMEAGELDLWPIKKQTGKRKLVGHISLAAMLFVPKLETFCAIR